MMSQVIKKRNVTVSLTPETVQKAKVLAAKRSTSISELPAEQIEAPRDGRGNQQARREALALLEKGLHLGGMISASRAELHER